MISETAFLNINIFYSDQFEDFLTVPDRYDDSSVSYFGGDTMTESPNSTEDEVSIEMNKVYSHDTITSLKGTYRCHADTIKMTECPLYEVVNQ